MGGGLARSAGSEAGPRVALHRNGHADPVAAPRLPWLRAAGASGRRRVDSEPAGGFERW